MSVSNLTSKSGPFAANGSQVNFPFSFKCFNKNDIQVVLTSSDGVESILTVDSDYTVTLTSNQNTSPGGTIATNVAHASGKKITIVSNISPTQTVSFTNFRPDVVEKSFDKLTLLVQQLYEQVSRAVKTSVSGSTSPDSLLSSLFTAVQTASDYASAAANSVTAAASQVALAAEHVATALGYANSASNSVGLAANQVSLATTQANNALASANAADVSEANALNSANAAASFTTRMPRRASSGSEVLTAADMGSMVVTSTASTLTLPLLSPEIDGRVIGFTLNSSVVVTVQRQGANELSWNQKANLNAVKMTRYGDVLMLWADVSAGRWRVIEEGIYGPETLVTFSSTNLPSTNGFVKAPYVTVLTDTHGDFNSSLNRFVASVPGLYMVTAGLQMGSTDSVSLSIFVNGVEQFRGSRFTSQNFCTASFPVFLSTGDYVEIFGIFIGSNMTFSPFSVPARFSVIRLN